MPDIGPVELLVIATVVIIVGVLTRKPEAERGQRLVLATLLISEVAAMLRPALRSRRSAVLGTAALVANFSWALLVSPWGRLRLVEAYR